MRRDVRAVVPLLLFGACTCGGGDEVIGRVVPRLELASTALDFGEVPVGATKRLALELSNTGAAELVIRGASADLPFSVSPSGELRVPAGGRLRVDVAFSPVDAGPMQGTLQIDSDADGAPTTRVTLAGVGVPGFVELRPRSVDFASTRVGTVRTVELVLENRGLEPIAGAIVAEGFMRPEHYTLDGVANVARAPTYAAGARSETRLLLEYLPLALGDDSGRLVLETCGPRCGVDVVITAGAIAASVRVEPAALDFGAVGLGQVRTEVVQVFNDASAPLDVGRVRVLGASEVMVAPARALPTSVDPGTSLVLSVSYRPTSATEMLGTLVVDTSDEGAPEARVRLSGRGVGPLFQVLPERLDFGIVSRRVAQRRSFVLLNAGSADVRVTGIRYSGHASMRLVSVPGLPARLGAGETLTPSVELVPTGTAGVYRGEVQVTTDDPAHADVRIPVEAAYSETACQLESAPTRLNFGLVTPPHSRSGVMTLSNRGDRACTITSGAFVAPLDPSFSVGAVTFPVTLGPQQALTLPFSYTPTDRREAKAVYAVQTDDAVFPERRLTLAGSSLAYDDLFVVPTDIDFGQLEPRCLGRPRDVRVFNAGTLEAVIDEVRLHGDSGQVSLMTSGTPRVIPAGGAWEFTLAYRPTAQGAHAGELEIVARDRPYTLITSWRGEGAAQAILTERFEQGRARPVDVLFVVDDSCSMSEEQIALTGNFTDFIRTANVRAVDFRIAITTTDVTGNKAGQLRGPIMTPSTSNLEQEFSRQANVGIGGSGFEQGLEAMDAALTRMKRANADFLRPRTSLVTIIVSDEDDGSPGSPVTYYNSLRAANADSFVATITGQAFGCQSIGTGSASPAGVYEAFVALTQGLSVSICAPWSSTLSNLGAAVFGLQQRFALQNAADAGQSIEVRVNGQVASPSTYRYEASPPAIVFDLNSLPPEGASVEVTYSPDC